MSHIETQSINRRIGARLLRFRESARLTQVELAGALGITARTFQNYERGEREISTAVVGRLYRLYGLDPVWLIEDDDGSPPRRHVSQLDSELLTTAMAEIDRFQEAKGRTIPASKKIQLLRLLYNYFRDNQQPDQTYIRDLLDLAA